MVRRATGDPSVILSVLFFSDRDSLYATGSPTIKDKLTAESKGAKMMNFEVKLDHTRMHKR